LQAEDLARVTVPTTGLAEVNEKSKFWRVAAVATDTYMAAVTVTAIKNFFMTLFRYGFAFLPAPP
jgi:hypothetical protein